MDASQTSQSLAQAVQAATQQAQQQAQHPSPSVQPPHPVHTSTIDNLTCQWQGCGERTDSAEALYDHVCERHVGRKSTNNLNLTCQWGPCRTTTVKRDHITSHIRVHVPLKPHKCDFCGKAFKRPQDLKKHVKTHADDSVVSGSPHQGHNGRSGLSTNPMSQSASGYYGATHDNGLNPYPSYQPSMATGATSGYAQHNNGQYAGYGSVSYPNSAAVADIQSMDTRRRAIEALNDFLGDIKRRAINPSNYYDVGQRLQGTSLPLPVGTGYNTGYSGTTNTYNGMSAASLLEAFNHGDLGNSNANAHGAVTQQNYSLPLPNARTKNDLQDIDRFLEQLQATVYETSNQAAAAGVQQPGMHAQYTGDFGLGHGLHQDHRSSHSPPSFQNVSGVSSFGNLSMSGTTAGPASTGYDTPALTPASSYSGSAHSPLSSHDRSSMTSMSGNAMYPSLPAVTGMSDLGSGYPTTTSAPASSLASGFDGLDGRRYSGGRLQRVAPGHDTDMADAEDRETTPKAGQAIDSPGRPISSTIDPALHHEDIAVDSPSTSSANDKREEDWVENIRAIEALRKWILSRLEQGDFEADADQPPPEDCKPATMDESAQQMAETAKMVEEKLADVAAAVKQTASYGVDDVQYPTLPGA
nr:ph-response transcription factor [Quercus suber]